MEKLLLIGIDTRSMLNSALKLDYNVYSASYFSTSDTPRIDHQKIILKEEDGESCGNFEELFSERHLLEVASEYLDEVDSIIPVSGISPTEFSPEHKKKILGNKNIGCVEDKLKFYKKIKNEFKTPMTFSVSDIDESIEINNNYPDNQFILKPVQGSGGYDINILNNNVEYPFSDREFILQEYIGGINLSSSVLSTESDAKTVINSRLLTVHDFEKNDLFIYVGNILPLTSESIMSSVSDMNNLIKEMNETSEKLIQKFGLVGSNGVDYIYNENGLYVIECNPRIQGTFECVERTLGINMLDAHIRACRGEIIDIPEVKCYSYKKIIYSPSRMKYEKINLNNIYDLPHIGSITEKDEPLLTIIDSDENFKKLFEKVESSSEKVNEVVRKSRLNVI